MIKENLIDDHYEDLYEFVINHIGMSSQESIEVCRTIFDTSDENLVNLGDNIFSSDETEKKSMFIQILIFNLSYKWVRMGFNELKVRMLIQKFIPFVVSIIFYKLEEKSYDSRKILEFD